MTIKFRFLLHLTCFLVVCSHRGFYLFGTFYRLFILAKSSSNSQQNTDNVRTFLPYYCPGTVGFPVWYTCTYWSQVLKIQHHNHIHALWAAILLTAGNPQSLPLWSISVVTALPRRGAGNLETACTVVARQKSSPLW